MSDSKEKAADLRRIADELDPPAKDSCCCGARSD